MRLINKIFFLLVYLAAVELKAQFTVTASVSHVDPTGSSGTGSITLNATGGFTPYTYIWTPSSSSISVITGTMGAYEGKVKDSHGSSVTHTYNLGYKARWNTFSGVKFRNDSLILSSPHLDWNTAVSRNTLLGGNDGWAEIVLQSVNNVYMLGFTDSISPRPGTYSDIDFGFYVNNSNLYFNIGGYISYVSSLTTGDVLRIERTGGVFYLKQNGTTTFSTSMSSTADYKLKAGIDLDPVVNIGTSFADSTSLQFPEYIQDIPLVTHASPGSNNGSIILTPREANGVHTYSWTNPSSTSSVVSSLTANIVYSVEATDNASNHNKQCFNVGYKTYWKDLYGAMFRNDSLIYSPVANSSSQRGNAYSKNTLPSNTNGWAEIVLYNADQDFILGFTDSIIPIWDSFDGLAGGFMVNNQNLFYVTTNTYGWLGYCVAGDILRVERKDSLFMVKQNSVTVYTLVISKTANYKLRASGLFGPTTAPLVNIGASFKDTTNYNFPGFVQLKPYIKHSSGELIADGSISLTPKYSETGNTYTWTTINQYTSSIDSLLKDDYPVTVKDVNDNASNYSYESLYKTQWTRLEGNTFSNDSVISKSPYTPTGWCTAVSKNVLKANTDGEVTWVNTADGKDVFIGFLDVPTSSVGLYTDIDFGIIKTYGNLVYRYMGGSFDGPGLSAAIGDVIKIKRTGNLLEYFINNTPILSNTVSTGTDWKVKMAQYAGTSIVDVGCSFKTTLDASISKQHVDLTVNPFGGSVAITPTGGISPYSITWAGLDGVTSFSGTGMGQASYTVTISDSSGTDKIAKIIDVGAKINWAYTNNITFSGDSAYATGSGTLGTAVSDNNINLNDETWYVGKIKSLTHDVGIGFVGVSNASDFPEPPDFASSDVGDKIVLADTLMQWAKRLAFPLNSAYGPDSVLDLGSSYNNVHMMRLRNGIMHSLSNGSAYRTHYTYQVGDEVKIGRNSNNLIYLAINGQMVYTHPINAGNQYMFPILVVNTGVGMSGPGVFTQGYNSDLNPHIGNFQLTDNQYNWHQEETYDESGSVIATQKTYYDGLGRITQDLDKNANNEVFTTQTLYDSYGRPALQTLPAPTTNSLTYYNNFFRYYWGGIYNYSNFDLPLTLNNPAAVANGTAGTLGNFYSDNNPYDSYQATADLPYTRIEYTGDNAGGIRRVSQPGNAFKMGSGRESYSFVMTSGDELSNVFGNGLSYKSARNNSNKIESDPLSVSEPVIATKEIIITPDNKEMITYSVGNKAIANCAASLTNSESCNFTSVTNTLYYSGTKSIDIHLPDANKSSLAFPQPTQATTPTSTTSYTNIVYSITDLYTDKKLVANTDYSLNTGTGAVVFYSGFLSLYSNRSLMLRISFEYNSTYEASLTATLVTPADINITYDLDYGHFSKNYYDLAGQLRKGVSPKGFSCGSPTVITMADKYDYDHRRNLIANETPDEGLTTMTYDSQDKLRFSQNADQANNKYFSYINYDKHGRPVETGECHTSSVTANSVWYQDYYQNPGLLLTYSNCTESSNVIDQSDGIQSADKNYTTVTGYVIPAGSYTIPGTYSFVSSYSSFRNGEINYMANDNNIVWFNYDSIGRPKASLTQITEGDFVTKRGGAINDCIKTSDGTYNYYNGLPSSSTYQQSNTAEKMAYTYTYDVNLRPAMTTFSWANGTKTTTLNTSSYNKIGRLKRVVLGENYQGLDFVYTLDGSLKAINHPGLDYTLDPGHDNGNYMGSGGVNKDLFGEILEYYNNDYQRSGTNMGSAISASASVYDGLVYATRFKTQDVVNTQTVHSNYVGWAGPGATTIIATANYSQQELCFKYTYDQFNRLATSNFFTYNNNSNAFTTYTFYSESGASGADIQYDKNGNITRLVRQAINNLALDNLTYTIGTNNNQLTSIVDAAVNNNTFAPNFSTPSTVIPSSFGYNAIGQMTASPAESITAVEYFPDGKVKKITFTSGNTTEYEYDAMGGKLKSKYYNAGTMYTKYNWYVGPVIYEFDEAGTNSFVIAQASIPGGELRVNYATITSSAYPVYHITDHLGNVRATFQGTTGAGTAIDILSYNDYYTFGGKLPGRNWSIENTRYGYQEQEKIEDGSNPWYQFDLRNYNQDIGRWFAPDPYRQHYSPYMAMANNPVNFIDPDGGWILPLYLQHFSTTLADIYGYSGYWSNYEYTPHLDAPDDPNWALIQMNEGMGGTSSDGDPTRRGGSGGGGSGMGMVRDENGNWVPESIYSLTHTNSTYGPNIGNSNSGINIVLGTTSGMYNQVPVGIFELYGSQSVAFKNTPPHNHGFRPDEPDGFAQIEGQLLSFLLMKQKIRSFANGFYLEAPTALELGIHLSKQLTSRISLDVSGTSGITVASPKFIDVQATAYFRGIGTKTSDKYTITGISETIVARFDYQITNFFSLFLAVNVHNYYGFWINTSIGGQRLNYLGSLEGTFGGAFQFGTTRESRR